MKEQAVKSRLKVIAKEKNTVFQDVWNQLLLERFLVRLVNSRYHDKFIFKGGLLLSKYLEIGRETRDLDFVVKKFNATKEVVSNALKEICMVENFDEFQFRLQKIEQLQHMHMNYPGFRSSIFVELGNMKDTFPIDIGIGDEVNDMPYDMSLFTYKDKPLFEGSISVQVYPVETIFAEKLETMVARGEANSRMKDFHDVVLMIEDKSLLNEQTCLTAIKKTFEHRKTMLQLPLSFDESAMGGLQILWRSHLNGLGQYKQLLGLPELFKQVIDGINLYLKQIGAIALIMP